MSIIKAFRQSSLSPRIVAVDSDPLSVGLVRADVAYTAPRYTDDLGPYLSRLRDICGREGVSLVCLGSEVEMRLLAPQVQGFEEAIGATVLLNDAAMQHVFMDKWETHQFLSDCGLPTPASVTCEVVDVALAFAAQHGYPLILKPRQGSGGQSVHVVSDQAELRRLIALVREPVLQELLQPADEEYTIGMYLSRRSGYVGHIAFRRTLVHGVTYKAEVISDPDIDEVVRAFADTVDVWGPTNLQLMKTPAGPKIFEVNLRFSSSAPMRAHFGFNEAEMCLRDLILGEPIVAPRVQHGYALRYWDEIYLDGEDQTVRVGEPPAIGVRGSRLEDF